MKYIKAILFSISLVLTLGSCTERRLSIRPADGPLRINFVWPDGSDGTPVEVQGAHLWLYGSDGTLYAAEQTGAEGYEARVPADTYIAIVVNDGCENAGYHGEESSSSCCMAAEDDAAHAGYLMQVDRVYCTGIGDITVNRGNVATEVTMYPENVVKYITFDIDPNYLDDIEQMQISMTGVVPSVYTMTGAYTSEPSGSVLADTQEQTDGHFTGFMSVFGWDGSSTVTADIVFEGGETGTTIPVDISDELDGLPEEGGTVDVTLELENGGSISLTVTVTPWRTGTGGGIAG